MFQKLSIATSLLLSKFERGCTAGSPQLRSLAPHVGYWLLVVHFIPVTTEVDVCKDVSVQSLPRVMPRHFVFITDLVCLSAWTTRYASLRINSNFDMRKVVRSVNHLFAFKHQPS